MSDLTDIKHYPVNDLLYSVTFQNAMNVLTSNGLTFNDPDVFEIIKIYNICLFFNDDDLLNDQGKEILSKNKKYLPSLKKAVHTYFKNITSPKISCDFACIQESLFNKNHSYSSADYFRVLSSNIDFHKCQNDIGEVCLKNVPLPFLIENKVFVSSFSTLIKSFFFSHPENFRLFVDQCDNASSNRKYHFPKFSDDEMDDLIKEYIVSKECEIGILELALLHRDSPETYRIKRKTRSEISKKLEELRKNVLNDKNLVLMPFHFDYGFIVSPCQKEPFLISKESGESTFSFSKAFFEDSRTWEQVFQKLINSGVLVNDYGSINWLYNPYHESTLSKFFETIHIKQYGSQAYLRLNSLNQTFFNFLYSNFAHAGKPFEDLAVWIVSEKINPLLNGSRLNFAYTKDDNFQIKCEHVFNQISSLLLQYRIFVEEGEITPSLIEETKDSLQISDLPSLIKDKYYDINPKSYDASNIMNLLFSDQSIISYVNKDIEADNFFNLISNNNVFYNYYGEKLKPLIDYLVQHSIIKIDSGILRFKNFETSFVWKFFYNDLFIPSYLVDDNVIKILNTYCEQKICRKYSRLFSGAESDYLDYIFNNSKFTNALALRNHYEHGQSIFYNDKQHQENYLIGFKTLLIILIKIYKDLDESRQLYGC